MSELPIESGSVECADEKKFLIWRNESFNINDAFAVNCRSEIYRRCIFLVNDFRNKDIDLRIVVDNRGAEIKIPIAGHRSKVLAVGIDYRGQDFSAPTICRPGARTSRSHSDVDLHR